MNCLTRCKECGGFIDNHCKGCSLDNLKCGYCKGGMGYHHAGCIFTRHDKCMTCEGFMDGHKFDCIFSRTQSTFKGDYKKMYEYTFDEKEKLLQEMKKLKDELFQIKLENTHLIDFNKQLMELLPNDVEFDLSKDDEEYNQLVKTNFELLKKKSK
jgi:hypothetical protein